MIYLKILKNSKIYYIYFLFIIAFGFYFSSCFISCKKNNIYYTVFDIDKNYGYLIPISFKAQNYTKEQIISSIVYNILKISVDKVENDITNKDNVFSIYLKSKPDLSYDYDTILAYDQLYFSFFYSQIYGNIIFYLNNDKLVLNGIDFSFQIDKINTKIFNNVFNLKRIDEGNYFLFSLYDKTRVIPIFLPNNYNLNITLSNNFNDKGLYSIKDFLFTNFNIKNLYVQTNNTFVIYSDNDKIDLKNFYFLFFNSNLEKIIFKGKKNIVLHRPKNFSFVYYSINNF